MSEFFAQPDDLGDIRASELHVGYGERLGAQAGEAFMGGVRTVGRAIQYGFAGGEAMPGLNMPDMPSMADLELNQQIRTEIPDTPIADAKARVKQEGLEGHLKLPEQDSIKGPVLDLMINHAHERRQYDAAIARGPQGFIPDALGFVTEIGAGMIDPVNAAAFSMPVLGEARLGMMLAGAGDSLAARAGVKAAAGAAQGAAGSTALLPADWALHTRDGQDYTMAQALRSVVLGAGMGAAAHAGIGAFRDVRARGRGEPLEGSPEDLVARGLMGGTHVHGSALAEEGVPAHEVPGIGSDLPPPEGAGGEVGPLVHPAEILADLPPRVRENVTQAAIADVIADRPVRAGEMLEIAGQQDPRIAESIEAWHGSPHDFEAFDNSKIGSGEGAQAYGHGLYFAQKEGVARSYQLMGDATVDGRPYDLNNPLHKASSLIDEHGSRAGAIADAKARQQHDPGDFYGDVLRHLESDRDLPKIETAGRMYRVRIKADPERMLDWDKPLSEQSAYVRNALENHPDPMIAGTAAKWGHDIRAMYNRIAQRLAGDQVSAGRDLDTGAAFPVPHLAPELASKALREAGIPGIKYLDQGSRDAGDGTRNFVVFNDKDIEITHKNGEPVTRAEIAAAHRSADVLPGPPAAKGPRARDESSFSLHEFLAHKGGLAPHPDLDVTFGGKNKFVPGFGNLIRRTGMSLDHAREAAVEAGYLQDAAQHHGGVTESTVNHLLEAIDAEARGSKQYRAGSEPEAKRNREQERFEMGRDLDGALEEVGIKPAEVSGKLRDRVLQIMEREGVSDPLVAHERAVMEETQRGAETGQAERIPDHIAGWDVPDDAGAAPGAGRPARPELVAGGAGARQAASAARPGDRGAPDAWRKLAEQRDPDAANDLAESREAAATPELASVDPIKAPSAAEKAAAEADKLLEDIKSKLTEAERARFDEVLAALSQDKEARDQVVRDGAACLLEAVG